MEMQFQKMILSMAWGGSEMQLTTRPARYLLRDEVDELKKTVGQNAVDPMKAIEQTTSNFPNKKIVDTATPTTPEGNIWQELKSCQYVFEYWVACPYCGVYQILYWDNVRFGEDHDPVVVEEMAYYECEACQARISNFDKIRILAGGEWRARATPDPCDQIMKNVRAKIEETTNLDEVLENKRVKRIGFHLPKWYSPFSGGTLGIIAKEFLEANKSLQEGDDFAPMRNWRIYNAARPWEEVAISETEIELIKNKIDIPPLICPQGTIALTAGIDPGQGGFWISVLAWRRDYGAHLIQYGWLAGDYDTCGIEEIIKEWTYAVDQEERRLHIWRIGIDTGGGQYSAADTTMTEAAYLWIRKMRSTRLFGTKGLSVERIRRIKESRIDKMPGDKGAIIPGGLILVEINSDAMKDVMWFHLRVEEGKAGRFTFHSGTESDYARHLLAEEKRMQKDGTWEWIRTRKENHLLDCTVIAFAMADSEFRGGIRVIRPPGQSSPQDPNKPAPINPVTQKPRGTWVKGW
jgi:terminase, large subunit